MSDPLTPTGVEFQHVSRSLATVRIAVAGISCAIPAIASGILGVVLSPWFYFGILVCGLIFVWLLWFLPRQVHAIRFATTDSDFLVRRGILFRRLDIVPYGRIQYVDVSEGPIARRLGIAEIQLHTASADTDATLDGLPVAEAARLRDLLVEGGSTGLSGL